MPGVQDTAKAQDCQTSCHSKDIHPVSIDPVFQLVEKIQDKSPETVWRCLWHVWIRIFRLPEVAVTQAKNFLSDSWKSPGRMA